MNTLILDYQYHLEQKYKNLIKNEGFWCVFALIFLIGLFAYAFYCTSLGFHFNGNVKLRWLQKIKMIFFEKGVFFLFFQIK